MTDIEPRRIATILASAPAWSRLALTSADSRLRERAADQIGALIVTKLQEPEPVIDPRQMSLL